MGAVKVVDRPGAYPGHTIWRKTKGPCVFIGQVIEGVHVYLNEQESRELVLAWGWPTREQHDGVVEERDEQAARVQALEQELAPLRDLSEAVSAATKVKHQKTARKVAA
jgi:hypothetical protein